MKFYMPKIFDLQTFDNKTTVFLKLTQSKYTVVHYASLNPRSVNKPL